MIHFDSKRYAILLFLYRRGNIGATWDEIRTLFNKDNANIFFLESLSVEGYTISQDEGGKWFYFKPDDIHRDRRFRSYITPKGIELVERRLQDSRRFSVSLLISVLTLIVSVISLLLTILWR